MSDVSDLFGVHYYQSSKPEVYETDNDQLYFFRAYIGPHEIMVEKGDCAYYFDEALSTAIVAKGPSTIQSRHLATVIRGYMHPDASRSLRGVTTLPYINGCSTKQLFPPIRPGDPTLQYLHVPPYSNEQEHHIHSTYRVVLVLSGKGQSVVGVEGQTVSNALLPGTICIFEPMSPHHFETPEGSHLAAVPLHVFSSIGPLEKQHPMFNGTIPI